MTLNKICLGGMVFLIEESCWGSVVAAMPLMCCTLTCLGMVAASKPYVLHFHYLYYL